MAATEAVGVSRPSTTKISQNELSADGQIDCYELCRRGNEHPELLSRLVASTPEIPLFALTRQAYIRSPRRAPAGLVGPINSDFLPSDILDLVLKMSISADAFFTPAFGTLI